MGSNYLANFSDGYGLTQPLATGLGELASAAVDAYLKRPEGLVYVADANGNPCGMAASTPTFTYKLQSAIAPGANVVATVAPANIRPDMVGDVIVFDWGNAQSVEACVIMSTTGNNQITLQTVQFAHAAQATGDLGRLITEDRNAPSKRSIIRICKWPIVSINSLLGRYAYGRRSDQVGGLYQEMNLLASVQTFGGPPQWVPITVAQCSWSDATGEVWVPAGMLLAYYSDVRARYVAGYQTVPDPIARAAAQIANAIAANSNMPGQIKMIAAGDNRIERFVASSIDADTKALLDPFKARTMF
jgi:hypothetical protein